VFADLFNLITIADSLLRKCETEIFSVSELTNEVCC